ncbi:hypothetical protein G6F24_011942 [Rhizopus arrhizus]|nr:hypothetical protein G6F24_011942 [Rhizopus arrhizus]
MKLSPLDHEAVSLAVEKFLKAGIIEISPTQNEDYLSNFFTIQEPTKRRPILDCSQLNQFLQYQHFKMEGVPALRQIIEKDDLMCKLDLKDAYVVVPIHPTSQQFLTFKHQNIVYQYRSMAFGLSVAPRVFTKIMRYALEPLRMQVLFYIINPKYHISDQLGEECPPSKSNSRIPWLCIQYQEDVNFSSNSKITEVDGEAETGAEQPTSESFMQMDSKSARQDDGDDTSNWKSVATPKILTTGLGSVSTQKSPKLGGALSIVQRKPIELN